MNRESLILGYVFQGILSRLRICIRIRKSSLGFLSLIMLLITPCIAAQTVEKDAELFGAVTKGDVGRVKELLQAGHSANSKNAQGITPLMMASAYGYTDIIEALLAKGANLNEKTSLSLGNLKMENVTAITFAAMSAQPNAVEMLLAKGAGVQRTQERSVTSSNLLINLIMMDNSFSVSLLAVAACGRQSQTEAQLTTLKTLLAKAKPEMRELQEALLFNKMRKHVDVQKLLEQSGAYIDPTNAAKDATTAVYVPIIIDTTLYDLGIKDIWLCAEKGDVTAVQEFFAQSKDADIRNSKGETPLMFAAQGGQVSVAEILLAKGADINLKDSDGNTALMEAARYSRVEMVKLLLAKKPDINNRNNEGETALKLAKNIRIYTKDKAEKTKRNADKEQVIQLLKSAGAK